MNGLSVHVLLVVVDDTASFFAAFGKCKTTFDHAVIQVGLDWLWYLIIGLDHDLSVSLECEEELLNSSGVFASCHETGSSIVLLDRVFVW